MRARSNTRKFLIAFVFAVCCTADAQQSNGPANLNDAVRAYVAQHRQEILREFEDFLAIPNLASDTANIQKNADALAAMLKPMVLRRTARCS